jgi:uncharacterized ion transporter superfamily protein YfcC
MQLDYLFTIDPLPIPSGWFDAVMGPLGAIAVLLLLVMAMVRQWLVPGGQYKQVIKERDEWKAIALRGLSKGEELVKIVNSA